MSESLTPPRLSAERLDQIRQRLDALRVVKKPSDYVPAKAAVSLHAPSDLTALLAELDRRDALVMELGRLVENFTRDTRQGAFVTGAADRAHNYMVNLQTIRDALEGR